MGQIYEEPDGSILMKLFEESEERLKREMDFIKDEMAAKEIELKAEIIADSPEEVQEQLIEELRKMRLKFRKDSDEGNNSGE
jgi:hypothetical protein